MAAGDSPASIASRPNMAGCPKCSNLLVAANPDLPTVTHPNGFKTFRELRVGQRLRLPDAWFDGSLDAKPQSYFDALPYADGVTLPKTSGVAQAASPPQPLQASPTLEKKGLSAGALVGIGLLAAVTVGGITYAATRKQKRRRRR